MKFRSVFDIIGPIMVGPSSSHTAGAARIGLFTRNLFNRSPKNIEVTLYGSFKDTYRGHGTDIAIIGGLLGCDTFDKGIRTSLEDAKNQGINFKFIESEITPIHPNTAKIELEGDGEFLEVSGKSIGGGKMVIFEIQGFDVEISADFPTIFVFFDMTDENKEKLEDTVLNFRQILKSYKFSSSIIEGRNLLSIEMEYYKEEIVECLLSLGFVSHIKYSPKI
ncbi:L-serine ammonia-lyase, iron-sulfur-dependent, subunit beta [Gemella sp. GH3]|uniref:L-serine ammonia-lyase, iron-sulfur-dependent subunit beta n=1 Tax=unclassified Gemella TaxID=2624949 RepID=UPI0015D095DD|nr:MULTISPECIES: L-serine ammonia-lyase, iron-sulfur-dependent subunit beta [unclassified Gemella]MBF0714302.1 L-serine ammonia-lyase, iron-sulfur-dependent, subunit beta [Gemella sp. GH3.1]NYS51254.1 L-serine ammonia-lyase, iron-sulfur-dependent, subunit beta [Gemella sp. GH3]